MPQEGKRMSGPLVKSFALMSKLDTQ
jgi:hypothetical protein